MMLPLQVRGYSCAPRRKRQACTGAALSYTGRALPTTGVLAPLREAPLVAVEVVSVSQTLTSPLLPGFGVAVRALLDG